MIQSLAHNVIDHLAPTLAALATLIAVWRGHRKQAKRLRDIDDKVWDIHLTINSRLTELLRLAKIEGHAEGVQEERDKK